MIDRRQGSAVGLPAPSSQIPPTVPRKKPTPSFEEALAELEALVEAMEQGELSLEESLKSFEQGVALTRHCQQALQDAEQKVRILTGESENAEPEPFERDD